MQAKILPFDFKLKKGLIWKWFEEIYFYFFRKKISFEFEPLTIEDKMK